VRQIHFYGFPVRNFAMTHWIVTANRLSDGGVTYLRADHGWTEALSEAWTSEDRDAAEARLAWARGREREVCDPYLVEVRIEDGWASPLSARERIRAEGPRPTLERLGYAPREASAPRAAAG
jgi:hypothetical protein